MLVCNEYDEYTACNSMSHYCEGSTKFGVSSKISLRHLPNASDRKRVLDVISIEQNGRDRLQKC